ncbi:FtsP/CotA-like multicopper oxidase with cupredoxin domain [Azospirillum lipoferum]|uniref:Multicopper oxidase domain-containing protein n=1 Tax=Azospirillum lipoferum TaxID=193 RepID=A0A5A9GS40_AZOLI|nr:MULTISPECIES: multicopper oxidase domain-containing protein [Azospirillum]KAA0597291.1 multicopper oxidase domain-containing protein [Azospirillum lipoferum]MCP1608813.1 FtsP/CotA-like multicopper oxidase with cupredoxin domain [Azospirillum lipoferum]MDW5535872.1 multicopper oxidase domain-containing protein [Azospirillum sp. NL1]
MTLALSRRHLLSTAVAGGCAALLPAFPRSVIAANPVDETVRLTVDRRTLEVNGKAASVFGIRQPDGTPGLTLDPGRRFVVDLANRAGEDAVIHWHGQTPPYVQDGVIDRNRPAIRNGESVRYDFTPRSGTHWMHSHHGMQEQLLMAAPLVVRSAEDLRADEQEVTILLHDLTFRDPAELLASLGAPAGGMAHGGHGQMEHGQMGHGSMDHGSMGTGSMDHGGMNHGSAHDMSGGMAMDLNDVDYDAYLANDRTLADPEVLRVERGGRVRLRVINGATSTAFHLDLGRMSGQVIAADGNPVQPVTGSRFGMSMGQRLDIRLTIPAEGGAFPILALREGAVQRTGIILATPGATVEKIAATGQAATEPLDLSLERQLVAVTPLAARPTDLTRRMQLTGSMMPYVWSLDGLTFGSHRPLVVRQGQRVELTFENASMMAHPMHLHGHHFQVLAIDGRPVTGAVRDTVLVPMMGNVTVAFDADNPGRWPLHCHNLLHMATGMMTEVVYEGFV